MADTQLKDLTAATSVITTDLLYTVVDPAGTPLDRQITVGDLAASIDGLIDHGALAGLTDDDHSQYARLGGRAGGQVLIGGTGSSDSLVLASDTAAYGGDTYVVVSDGNLFGYLSGVLQFSLAAAAAFNRAITVGTDPDGPIPGNAGLLTLWTDDDGSSEPAAATDKVKLYAWDQAAGDTRLKVKSESGNAVILGNGTVQADRLASMISTGTSPLVISSTTVVANLNADLIDGQHASSFAAASHSHAASDIVSGMLATARGGLNTDISSVAKGGLVAGTGSGTFGLQSVGTDDQLLAADSAQSAGLKWIDVPLPTLYRYGLMWYRDGTDPSNDIDVYSGACRSNDDTENIRLSADPLIKRLDASWSVGTNAGGLDTGSKAANTWYWLWAIKRTDTSVCDVLLSTSNTAPTMPASYDKRRLIGAVRTDGSGNLRNFDTRWVGNGIYFRWIDPAANGLDVSATGLGTSRVTYTLSDVPAFGNTYFASVYFDANVAVDHGSTQSIVYIANPDHTDSAPSLTAAPLATVSMASSTQETISQVQLYANRAAQITARSNNTNTTFRVQVLGFFWPGGI